MAGGPTRVTEPLLDVLEVLVAALAKGEELHGWAIMKATGRSGPTVYGVLDRLEDAGWIEGRWEEQASDSSRPRRRLYGVTPNGEVPARNLLAERREARRRTKSAHPKLGPAFGAGVLRRLVGGAG